VEWQWLCGDGRFARPSRLKVELEETPYFCVGAWFCGTVGGAAGAGVAGCDFVVAGFTPESTEVGPVLRAAKIESVIDVNMKMIADQVVARESTDAAPRGPNAVWLPCPPKAAARSPLLPLCNNTTAIRKKQTTTCTIVIRTVTNMQETPKRAEAQISKSQFPQISVENAQ
jgi:hypothetical protein